MSATQSNREDGRRGTFEPRRPQAAFVYQAKETSLVTTDAASQRTCHGEQARSKTARRPPARKALADSRLTVPEEIDLYATVTNGRREGTDEDDMALYH